MSGRQLLRGVTRCLEYLLAPGVCLGCGSDPGNSGALCKTCGDRIARVPNPCQHCGEPNPIEGLICPACRLNPPAWQKMIAPLEYRGISREYLLRLKRSEAIYLAECLCRQALPPFQTSLPRPQALLPVPLYRDRLLERGYNQAREIARIFSAELDIPVDRHCLSRVRATPLQSGLSAAQRKTNVRQAFACSPRRDYRHVAVVDDIVTTGSTVTEITRLLHRAGVEHVEIWALARAYRR